MKIELKLRNTNISISQIISEVKRVSKKLNKKNITRTDFDQHGKFGSHLVVRKIGWNKAKEKAGLQIRSINISDKELMDNLYNVWIKLKSQPIKADLIPPISKYSVHPYVKRFGSWTQSLKYFMSVITKDKLNYQRLIALEKLKPYKHKTPRTISATLKIKVLNRDRYTCPLCPPGEQNDPKKIYVIDHVKPYSKGGETILENLRVMCKDHNSTKGALILNSQKRKK
jgi:hypothetical protein